MLSSIRTQVMPCMVRVLVLLAVPVTCAVILVAIARTGNAPIHHFQQMAAHPAGASDVADREVADLNRPRG
jgi:hypothetical protein